MRRMLLGGAFLFLMVATAAAQKPFPKNDIYLEAGGTGFYGSVNYERQLGAKPGLGVRIGTGFFTYSAYEPAIRDDARNVILKVPFGLNYLFALRGGASFVDLGLNVTYDTGKGWTRNDFENFHFFTNDTRDAVAIMPGIGFRRHTKGNWMWRISFTPLVNTTLFEKGGFYPWGGVSVGTRF